MSELLQTVSTVVTANRILAREGIVDALGHVSLRHPEHPDRYLLSCSRSPELVVEDDIMAFTLDGEPVDDDTRAPYTERFIHGALYVARPDVNSVVHNHAYDVIPFGVTEAELRPIIGVAAAIGERVPVWDIRDRFGDTNLLVTNMEQGRDLAGCVGDGAAALMRGHGAVTCGPTVAAAVLTAIYLAVNAQILQKATALGNVNFLTPGEVELCRQALLSDLAVARIWQYLARRAGRG